MPEPIRVDCAKQFGDIQNALGGINVKMDSLTEDTVLVKKALIGNGVIEKSVMHRLLVLEASDNSGLMAKKRWSERTWQLFKAAGLVAFGFWIKS